MSLHHVQIKKPNHRKRHAMAQIMAGTEDIVSAVAHKACSSMQQQPAGSPPVKAAEATEAHEPSSRYTATKTLPTWITNDRQVLRFFCYFLDSSSDDSSNRDRSTSTPETSGPPLPTIRRLVLHYYLSDASIEVCEPRVVNSGLDQGLFLRRTILNHPSTSQPYTPSDLVVGSSLPIKGRLFTLVDCDAATREYYVQAKQPQPPAKSYPDTPPSSTWTEVERIKMAGSAVPPSHHPRTQRDPMTDKVNHAAKVHQFMTYSNKVLRFFCRWDDPHPLYPVSRPFVLHYYLADDTVEVREATKDRGSSRHAVLLSRRRLPFEPVPTHHHHHDRGSPSTGRIVHPLDLRCGDGLMVFGRCFNLIDCDEFTRAFYLDTHGVTQESQTLLGEPAAVRVDAPEPDDSILRPLLQKSERKAISKPLGVDQCLRFRAKFASPPDDIQANRRFILSFYLLDATLAIFEPHVPNSGRLGGKFLDRQSYKLHQPPGGNRFVRAGDLVVGGTLQLHLTPSQTFMLLEADDQTLTYCEDHPEEFPHANIDLVLRHVVSQLVTQSTSLRHVFRAQASLEDGKNLRQVTPQAFDHVLRHRIHLQLHPHEELTLRRRYGRSTSEQDQLVWYDVFCDAVSRTYACAHRRSLPAGATTSLDTLRQLHVNLRGAMLRVDTGTNNGIVPRSLLEKLLGFYQVHLPAQLLDRFEVSAEAQVDYHRFFDAVYPCDLFQEDERSKGVVPADVDASSSRRPVVPMPVPDEGPLYAPTPRTNLDTERFGVLGPLEQGRGGAEAATQIALQRPQQRLPMHDDDVRSVTSSLASSTPFSTADLSQRASLSAKGDATTRPPSTGDKQVPPPPPPISATPLDQSYLLPLSRFQTTNQRVQQESARTARALQQQRDDSGAVTLADPTIYSRRRHPATPTGSTPIQLTKDQKAALYKTTSQRMLGGERTAALTSQRAADVISRARAKLVAETKRNPLVPLTVTDVDAVDPSSKALFANLFAPHKYELRKALRQHDHDKCGFVGNTSEDEFMDALASVHPDMTDEDRYRLADAFFPSVDAHVNYKHLLDVALVMLPPAPHASISTKLGHAVP
ncbi:hypothetical protein DYB28_000130 [Aphanomyces astaci]|uniref:DM10 domain-containing protein n=1 Tax=Aphanomyces astaci TaxID=112090 RepID=A0A9X8E1T0_APHAT|nr:hypothetical protein DYB28_000130 [Aphanomyces astaci]